MGLYVDHSICIRDEKCNNIVSGKQIDKFLAKSAYYKKHAKYWDKEIYFSTGTPIVESELDFTIEGIMEFYGIKKEKNIDYFFYHTFTTESNL